MAAAEGSLLCSRCDVRWPQWAVKKRQKQVARAAADVCPCCEKQLTADPGRPVDDSLAKHFLFEHFYVKEWPAIREARDMADLEQRLQAA